MAAHEDAFVLDGAARDVPALMMCTYTASHALLPCVRPVVQSEIFGNKWKFIEGYLGVFYSQVHDILRCLAAFCTLRYAKCTGASVLSYTVHRRCAVMCCVVQRDAFQTLIAGTYTGSDPISAFSTVTLNPEASSLVIELGFVQLLIHHNECRAREDLMHASCG